jgi:hypothetical protein
MTKLSDTQAVILGAAAKVVETMIAKGLIEEVDANLRGSEPVWRETGDGHGTTLVATRTGLAAIGIEPEDANTAPAGATDTPTETEGAHAARGHQAGHADRHAARAGRRNHRGNCRGP